MDTYTYPGKGLPLLQLIFAPNEELKRAAYSPSYVAKVHYGLARGVLRKRSAGFRRGFTFDGVPNSPKMPQPCW
jgi:hypothetical protein